MPTTACLTTTTRPALFRRHSACATHRQRMGGRGADSPVKISQSLFSDRTHCIAHSYCPGLIPAECSAIFWQVGHTFHDCIYSPLQMASFVIGMGSILCWVFAQAPWWGTIRREPKALTYAYPLYFFLLFPTFPWPLPSFGAAFLRFCSSRFLCFIWAHVVLLPSKFE